MKLERVARASRPWIARKKWSFDQIDQYHARAQVYYEPGKSLRESSAQVGSPAFRTTDPFAILPETEWPFIFRHVRILSLAQGSINETRDLRV